jgi:hypothetical protein
MTVLIRYLLILSVTAALVAISAIHAFGLTPTETPTVTPTITETPTPTPTPFCCDCPGTAQCPGGTTCPAGCTPVPGNVCIEVP